MPRIFHRNRAAESNAALHTEQVATLPETALTPELFLESQNANLQASRQAWHVVHSRIGTLRSDDIIESLQVGVANNFKGVGVPVTPEFEYEAASTMSEDLAATWLIAARHTAESVTGVSGVFDVSSTMFKYFHLMPSQSVRHAVTNMPKPTRRALAKEYTYTVFNVQEADIIGDHILDEFVKNALGSTRSAEAFNAYISEHVGDLNVKELRRLVSVDWYHANPQKSKIKQHFSKLRDEPRPFVMPFIEKIVHDADNRELETIRRMAAFALLAIGSDNDSTSMTRVLYNTHGVWDADEQLGQTFAKFVDDQIITIEQSVARVAGRFDGKDIRTHHSADTVQNLFDSLDQRMPLDRATRRVHKRAVTRLLGELPNTAEIVSQVTEALPEVKREMRFAKQTQSGLRTEVRSIEELCADIIDSNFTKRKEDVQLQSDITAVLTYLQTTPILLDKGFVRLGQGGSKTQVDGKPQAFWRFAPDKAPGVRISGQNRYIRVVCAYEGQKLMVIDVLSHDDFDKKYK